MSLEKTEFQDDPTTARLVLRRSLLGRRRYVIERPWRRDNNLYPALGLLELSNALDFAANLWNAVPPPVIAMVFMALGATGALVILLFASLDFPRAWRNTSLLRQERARLLELEQRLPGSALTRRNWQTYVDINHRELGNETIDRLVMFLFLGFGALTVGIGTYMAMDGANPAIYLASNIITGYVGNVPAALYGLLNAAWCFYGWRRAHRFSKASGRRMIHNPWTSHDVDIAAAIHTHGKRVKHHATINGISGILGGAGSLMTASTYIYSVGAWGYIILIVCVISAVYVNLYWRWRVNCDRDIGPPIPLSEQGLLNDLGLAVLRKRLLRKYCHIHWVAEFFGWTWHLSDRRLGGDGLRKFLLDYYVLTAQWLVHQETQLSGAVAAETTIDEKDEKFQSSESSLESDGLHRQFTSIRTQLDEINGLISSLRTAGQEDADRHATDKYLASVLFGLLVSAGLFPDLCARLANNSHTFRLLRQSPSPSSEKTQSARAQWRQDRVLSLESQQVWQCLSDQMNASEYDLDDFLAVVRSALAVEGMHAARSRVREECERVGCYLALGDDGK